MATPDIATLGFGIDSFPLGVAATGLDGLAAAGKRAEDAVSRMSPRMSEAANKARNAAGGLSGPVCRCRG